ncbi:cation channel family protein [Babesia ovis]|uniref:Cation channel family protein n=1 Tax=Babesia ovis TaxID=5869 RepID=A0A9W5TB28_BABOV|nr:cation channel family protein [Babesia ovis]
METKSHGPQGPDTKDTTSSYVLPFNPFDGYISRQGGTAQSTPSSGNPSNSTQDAGVRNSKYPPGTKPSSATKTASANGKTTTKDRSTLSIPLNTRLTDAIDKGTGKTMYNQNGSTETDGTPDQNVVTLKYCGSSILDANRYRQDVKMITRGRNVVGFPLRENRYYRIIYLSIIALYGILLGWSTLIDWSSLSTVWIISFLTVRFGFLLVFAFDVVLQASKFTDLKIYRDVEFMFDILLFLAESLSMAYLTTLISRDCIVHPGLPTGQCATALHSLKLWSCLPLLRFYKLCKSNDELHHLSKGIILSVQSLSWTALFVFMVMYASAIYTTWRFTDVDDETMDEHWGTLLRSMYTLFTILTLEGWNEISSDTAKYYPNAKVFFVLFVTFATLTVMNVVTGIILNTFLSSNEKLSGQTWGKGRCNRYMQMCKAFRRVLGKRDVEDHEPYSSHSSVASFKTCHDNVTDDGKDEHKLKHTTANMGNGHFARVRNYVDHKVSADAHSLDIEHGSSRRSSVLCEGKHDSQPHTTEMGTIGCSRFDHGPQLYMDGEKFKAPNGFAVSNVYQQMDNAIKMTIAQENSGETSPTGSSTTNSSVLYQQEGIEDTIIDMTVCDPCEILSDKRVKRVLGLADVPMYQAYEVLKIYYEHGLRRVTVTEFAVACERMNGTATGKDLLSFEVAIARRVGMLEEQLIQLNEKLDLLLQRGYTAQRAS